MGSTVWKRRTGFRSSASCQGWSAASASSPSTPPGTPCSLLIRPAPSPASPLRPCAPLLVPPLPVFCAWYYGNHHVKTADGQPVPCPRDYINNLVRGVGGGLGGCMSGEGRGAGGGRGYGGVGTWTWGGGNGVAVAVAMTVSSHWNLWKESGAKAQADEL